ncbi:hypothetical protein PIROE2DRAFT_62141 [Piromyces sp. E2]|nr:hypothetical protein PIROE2DRAFT_62141 [Piromyces sp. E2]|eukprot:OUM62058.1 hypothetical protein PIROE2DRAFT_62141 [Piromyces sp. E2]
MKSIGIFFVLACSYIVSVLAGPTPSVYMEDSNYEYYAQEGFTSCYVTKLTSKAKSAKTLTFDPYVTDKRTGTRYYVGGLMADLTDSVATKIEIPSSLRSSFSISENVLKNAKKLTSLKVESTKGVYVYDNTFTDVNKDINIYGKGVNQMVTDYVNDYLKYNYPDLIQNYSKLSEYDARINLYNIAKIINRNFKFNINMANGDNGAVAFLLKEGSTVGL